MLPPAPCGCCMCAVEVALYAPPRPLLDPSEAVLWGLAVSLLLVASSWAAAVAREEEGERKREQGGGAGDAAEVGTGTPGVARALAAPVAPGSMQPRLFYPRGSRGQELSPNPCPLGGAREALLAPHSPPPGLGAPQLLP